MRLFERKNILQVFKFPRFGQVADQVPPKWLVSRLQSGELVVNAFGGVTIRNRWGHQQCAAGDYVVLTDHNRIEFASEEDLAHFEPVVAEQFLRSA